MTSTAAQPRTLPPARIVALVLIAVVMVGLTYIRVGSASHRVSVPAGAKAGELDLKPCTYGTEDGTAPADCGTLIVPENRSNPRSRLVALPVTRIRSRSDHPKEPVFRLEGGPGITNMEFTKASRFLGDRDVVLVGYRGVDGSSVLDCPEVSSALKRSTDRLSDSSFRAFAGGFRSCAERLTGQGVDLAGYSQTQQVEDMEAARVALGYDKVDLLSESAGTRTAMIYAWRHPEQIHRSVMIGVNPPGHYVWDPAVTDRQLRRYAELCAKDDSCSRRTNDLVASFRRTETDLPDRWGILPINKANARIGSFLGLFETASEMAPLTGPMVVDTWLSAAAGDPSGLWLLSAFGDFVFPHMFTWGEFAAVGVQDAGAARSYFSAGGDPGSILGNPATAFLWAGGRLPDAWPANADDTQYGQVRPSSVETLLIGGELDFSTPPEVAARELLPFLPNGHQVVIPGLGHSGSFYNDQPDAGTRLINTFLDSGQVDQSLYQPATVDFTPGAHHASLAKTVAGIMAGMAVLTILTLLALALRVRRRGQLGPVASALVRSILVIFLGLGGWFLGTLVVLATMPGVSLDNQLLAVVSVSVPVALAISLAWVHRDRSAGAKLGGVAAVAGGSVVGAWLGFHAATELFALVTAIAGAIATANLAVILFEVRQASRGRSIAPAPRDSSTLAAGARDDAQLVSSR
ncbi:MAG TPA: alpha/beta hydrolase [Acidimicrobiales bacterium]|nr:alpha/beta hydrolase [Acidimicrobiales bacterium]